MTSKSFGPFAAIAVGLGLLFATSPLAQDFSPYMETTGRGAYDQYWDALLCNAVLEREIETTPDSERRPHLEQGAGYTANFALFLLESGNVVDRAEVILAPDTLPIDRHEARADWGAMLDTLEHEAVKAEIGRCLRLYGHEWK